MNDDESLDRCTTPQCPGDPHYASPGKGHLPSCQYPLPYDGDTEVLEFEAHEATTSGMAPAMTIVYLFGAAWRDSANDPVRQASLRECKEMLERRAPFKDIGQAILDAMGPLWAPDPETMQAIEAINRKD